MTSKRAGKRPHAKTVDSVGEPAAEPSLAEVLAAVRSLERLVLASHLEQIEGNEPFEGEPLLTALSAAPVLRSGAAANAVAASVIAATTLSIERRIEQFIDGLGFPNFKGHEFTPYWSRVRNGVRNSPPPQNLWENIAKTLAVLQRFRTEFGAVVRLTSTYRSPAYNNAVGGAGESQHSRFRAIDFVCTAGTPSQWAARLRGYRGQQFADPLNPGDTFAFRGGIGLYNTFVHIDTRGVDVDWQG